MRTSARKAWILVQCLQGKRATTRVAPLSLAGLPMRTAIQEAEAFTRYFSKVNKADDPVPDRSINKAVRPWQRYPGPHKRPYDVDFNLAELVIALGKAPGRDGVTSEMLAHLGPVAMEKLLRLYNRTWQNGSLPVHWRTAVIIPIHNKEKSPKEIASYRLISLTSVISKTMERMVNARLYHSLKEGELLDENQAGFRRFRATSDQLIHFTQSVINAWQERQHTVAVFVDLQQAYDRVWRTGLLLKLQRLGISGKCTTGLKDSCVTGRSELN